MRRGSAVIAAVLLAGCLHLEDPAPSQESRLVVHAVLDLFSADQEVLLYRARTGLPNAVEVGNFSDDEPVGDALVSMTGPDGVTTPADRLLTQLGDCCVPGTYLFRTAAGGLLLRTAGTYTLHISTTAGEEVMGTTTIPGPAHPIQDPARIFFRLRDTLRLTWTRVPGAASYEVIFRSSQFGEVYRTFADSALRIAGTALTIAGDEIFQRGQDVSVLVSAVDANYYDYYRSQSDPFAGAAPSHLSGAVGVFGSIVPIYATQLLVR